MKRGMLKSTLVVMILSCMGCINGVIGQPNNKSTDAKMIKLKKFSCIDQQGTGTEAFSILMPPGWKFEGGINWPLQSPSLPGVVECTISNPAGDEEFEIHRDRIFYWTDDRMILGMFPMGSIYLGSVVMPPMNALEFIKKVIIPQERADCQNLRIVSEIDEPEGSAISQVNYKPSGAKVRITYNLNGKEIEEELFARVEAYTFPIQQSMYGGSFMTNWTSNYCFSFKTVKGKLTTSKPLFETMMSSYRLNQKWFAQYIHFTEFLAQQQIQRSNQAVSLSKYISRVNDQITANIRETYEARNNAYDKVFQNWSDATLGVERYHDSFGSEITVPGGYSNVWGNNNGEYILSENPNFNPNIGSNLNWKQLEKP